MRYNQYSHLAHQHATLSASNNAWTNYDLEKLEVIYRSKMAAARGTELHDFAAQCIKLKQRLEDTTQTINAYVNDAIGYRMIPEYVLFYTMDAYGTADAITDRDNILRIHDLKTGLTETTFRQHEVYAAYYCLSHKVNPMKLEGMEFRIYQSDHVKVMEGDPQTITQIMETTKIFAPHLAKMRSEMS